MLILSVSGPKLKILYCFALLFVDYVFIKVALSLNLIMFDIVAFSFALPSWL